MINSVVVEDDSESINKVFKISKENFFILPFAFNRSGSGKF